MKKTLLKLDNSDGNSSLPKSILNIYKKVNPDCVSMIVVYDTIYKNIFVIPKNFLYIGMSESYQSKYMSLTLAKLLYSKQGLISSYHKRLNIHHYKYAPKGSEQKVIFINHIEDFENYLKERFVDFKISDDNKSVTVLNLKGKLKSYNLDICV